MPDQTSGNSCVNFGSLSLRHFLTLSKPKERLKNKMNNFESLILSGDSIPMNSQTHHHDQ